MDTGILCNLLGIYSAQSLELHPLMGSLFENFVIMEYIKQAMNQGRPDNFCFYRDHTGNEVDLIIQDDDGLTGIEIKSSETFLQAHGSGLRKFLDALSNEKIKGMVVYRGAEALTNRGIRWIPFSHLGSMQ